MMMGFGMAEVLVLALMSGGVASGDLVGIIQPADYFKSRQIDPTVDRMIDLVIQEPKSPKAQITQLVCLRHIADTAAEFKKAKNYETNRIAIEEIAEGKRGKDPQGFAQEYAKIALAKLDGKTLPDVKVLPLRDHALTMFPADIRVAYAIDLRQGQDVSNVALKDVLKQMPKQAKDQMYNQLEKIGNYRVDRISFAMIDGPNRNMKFYVHASGKGNPDWLEQMMSGLGGRMQSKRMKAPDDTPVVVLSENGGGPSMLIIGDTDFVIVGHDRFDGRNEDMIAEILDVRAKKKPNGSTGLLKDSLAKVPDKALALMIGNLSEDMKKDMARGLKLEVVPTKFAAYAERAAQGLDAKGEVTMANAEEAGKLVKRIGELRKEGVEELKREMARPQGGGRPQPPFQAMINLMETVQIQSNGAKVEARGFVSNALIQQMGMLFSREVRGGFDEPIPPPPKVKCE